MWGLNVRIERLWRDTFRCVLSVFHQLFYFLEDREKLDPTSEQDLFCLHFVYLPRINKALEDFKNGWNNHALTTECCRTPLQLFTSGSLSCGERLSDAGYVTLTSGLDPHGVTVPEMNFLLTPAQMEDMKRNINPLQESTNYGIKLYEAAVAFVENI